MGNTLMSLLVKLGVDVSDLNKGLSDAEASSTSSAGKIGSSLSSIGGVALKGVGVAAAGAASMLIGTGTAIVGMGMNAAKTADDLLVMSVKTGIGVEKLQEMKYAAELIDVPLETMTGSFSFLTRAIGEAGDSASEKAGMFKSLGIDIYDASGKMKSTNNIWLESIDALGAMENATERDIMTQQLFGKSFMDLKPLISAGTDDLRKYGEEARTSGAIVSTDAVNAAGALDDAMQKVKATISGVSFRLGAQFAPAIAGFVTTAGGYLNQFGSILADTSLTTDQKITKAADVVGSIAKDITAGLPKLLTAATGIIQSLVTGLIQAIPVLLPAVVQMIIGLVNFLIMMIPMIIDAGLQIVVALVMGIAQALPMLIPAIVQMLMTIIQVIVENIPMLLQASIAIVLGLIEGIVNALPLLIEQLPVIVMTIVNVIIKSLPLLHDAAVKIILALVNGIVLNLPQLIAAIINLTLDIIKALIDALPMILDAGVKMVTQLIIGIKEMWPKLVDIAKETMNGFWEGLKSKFAGILDGIRNFVKDVIDTLKGVLGISSPSKVFAGIGQNMMLGLAKGIEAYSDVPLNMTANIGANSTSGIPSTSGAMGGEFLGVYQGPSAIDIANALAYKLMAMGAVG